VVAPLYWLGFARGVEEPCGALPSGWIRVAGEDRTRASSAS